MLDSVKRLGRQVMSLLFGGTAPLEPPPEPYARVRVPRRSGPGGRNAAVAIAEPADHENVSAVTRSRLSRPTR